MWSAGFLASVFYLFLGANLFSRRSPYFHDRGFPKEIWANGPMKLVDTPWKMNQKADLFTTAATHMALVHNSIIRGYNSIYLQAPHIRDEDLSDFVAYALTWHKFVVSHHDDEEEKLFPDMVSILGDSEIWGNAKEEHESFLPGLAAYQNHLNATDKTTTLRPESLLSIMDSFATDLETHLHNEVATMAAMATHPDAPPADSLKASLARDMLKAWGKNTVTKAGYLDVLPFFLLNTDRTFENGAWVKWPRMPEPIRWSMVNLVGMWHGSRWRFASCDASGFPRELFTVKRRENEAKGKKGEKGKKEDKSEKSEL